MKIEWRVLAAVDPPLGYDDFVVQRGPGLRRYLPPGLLLKLDNGEVLLVGDIDEQGTYCGMEAPLWPRETRGREKHHEPMIVAVSDSLLSVIAEAKGGG